MRRTTLASMGSVVGITSILASAGPCTQEVFNEVCDLGLVDLSGFWRDPDRQGRRNYIFTQAGSSLTSVDHPDTPGLCVHEDGQGTTSTSKDEFVVVIDRCEVRGMIAVCRSGFLPPEDNLNGIVDVPFVGIVSSDGKRITGTAGPDEVRGLSFEIEYERLACAPKPPSTYLGLPGSSVIEFFPVYFAESETMVYTGADPSGLPGLRRVTAGVDGLVTGIDRTTDDQLVFTVTVTNGNRIEFTFVGTNGSSASVNQGDVVTPETVIGRLGTKSAESGVYTLEVRAFQEGTETPINPDCVELE